MPSQPRIDKVGAREPIVIEIEGIEYQFPMLTLHSLRAIQAWIATQPSPLDKLKTYIDGVPVGMHEGLYRAAVARMENWPPRLGTPESLEYVSSVDGIAFVAATMLRQGRPDITNHRAVELVSQVDAKFLDSLLDHAMGVGDEEGKEDPESPKAKAPAQGPPSHGGPSSVDSQPATGGTPG